MAGFYLIKSRLSGLVLDIEKSNTTPGAKVIPWKKHGQNNQLWYDDPVTGTIRSKLNHFCLDVEAEQLVAKTYQAGDVHQQWERHEHQVRNKAKPKTVLDIFGKSKKPGSQIGSYEFNGGENQLWDFEFVGGITGISQSNVGPRRDFYIVSELHQKVVDLQAGSDQPDTKIIVWTKDTSTTAKRNQLWYIDGKGFIRSALNNFVFQNAELGDKLKTKPFSDDPRGHWAIIEGKRIVNGLGECLDIKGDKTDDGASLISYTYKGSPNQHWLIQYI
jgi:hypothetical protein